MADNSVAGDGQNVAHTSAQPEPRNGYTGSNGKFVKNNPGRPRGAVTKRGLRKEAMFNLFEFGEKADARKGKAALKPRIERIKELLSSVDPNVRMQAERFVWEADFGKAKQTVDVFHQSQVVAEAAEKMEEFVEQGLHLVPDLEEKSA